MRMKEEDEKGERKPNSLSAKAFERGESTFSEKCYSEIAKVLLSTTVTEVVLFCEKERKKELERPSLKQKVNSLKSFDLEALEAKNNRKVLFIANNGLFLYIFMR